MKIIKLEMGELPLGSKYNFTHTLIPLGNKKEEGYHWHKVESGFEFELIYQEIPMSKVKEDILKLAKEHKATAILYRHAPTKIGQIIYAVLSIVK